MVRAIFGDGMSVLFGFLFLFLLGLLGLVLFLIPTFVAVKRDHPNKLPIILVNLFLGATLVGWVVALVWSFTSEGSAGSSGQRN